MRFYTKQHQFYCGIDLHARTMYLCILNQGGEILVHRNMPAGPEPFLKAVAPYREDLVVCVECLFTWYWLADLCARAGIPFVLGHALYMKAIHGGKAKNDTIDAQKIAVLLRGGMLHYLNDTCPGHSGSPVWVRRHPSMGGRVLVAVHVARDDGIGVVANRSVLITPAVRQFIVANTV